MRLFIRQGYHGTSIRDVAREAGISIGNIYHYYPTKEALYVSPVKRYRARMAKAQARLKPLLGKFDAESLRALDGSYRFPLLLPGSYTLAVDASGFQTYKTTGMAIRITEATELSP